jgi:hypothetical protein
VTRPGPTSPARAAAARAIPGACVGAHTSSRSPVQRAVAVSVSSAAWGAGPAPYSAEKTLPSARAASASPLVDARRVPVGERRRQRVRDRAVVHLPPPKRAAIASAARSAAHQLGRHRRNPAGRSTAAMKPATRCAAALSIRARVAVPGGRLPHDA